MLSTKEGLIRTFIFAGYPLIQLNGKIPIYHNWEKTKAGEIPLPILVDCNYGVVLGPEDLVVDVDPRNYSPKDDKPLARLFKDLKIEIPPTFIVRTGGGGLHIYLKKPAEVSIVNSLPDYSGVEFKSGPGRQVVGPGSLHPESKKEYTVLRGSPFVVAQAPQQLIDLIKKKKVPFAQSGTGEYKDDETTQSRYQDYLRRSPVAVQGVHGDDTTFKIALAGRDFGLSPSVVYALIQKCWNPRCSPPWGESELRAKVTNAYEYASGALGNKHPAAHFTEVETEAQKLSWKLDGKKQPIRCFQNLLNYFKAPNVGFHDLFGYNEFARYVEFLKKAPSWDNTIGAAVQDIDLQQMRGHLATKYGYDAAKEDLIDAMVVAAQRNKFHPVKKYLTRLTWDNLPRLDTWLIDYLGAEDDAEGYTRAVGRKTLCAAVARIFEPGVKFDHVLVLEGIQDLGKSGVCRVLGGEWFADFRMNIEKADTVQMMQGKWIVEMADLHMVRQTDIDTMKAFLTRQMDEARFAYGRLPGKYKRQSIFIATYNPGPDGAYLRDDTGNRRWWPVKCNSVGNSHHFDFKGLTAARNQLFAEAMVRYNQGEALTMETETLRIAAKNIQEQRHTEHPWTERIGGWLKERSKTPETSLDFYTGREIYIGAMQGMDTMFNRREAISVAQVMRTLGWNVTVKRFGDEVKRGYQQILVSSNGDKAHSKVQTVETPLDLDIFEDLV